MTRALIIVALLTLSGCVATAGAVNCGNAAMLRSAAQATIETIDYACAIPAS